MTTDEEAEAFLEQDLSDLDFSQFRPAKLIPNTETVEAIQAARQGEVRPAPWPTFWPT